MSESPSPPRSVLVTGMPRSGTTWLARELGRAHGCGAPGREPMNPRHGQYALGGTVSGWTRLSDPSPRQQRILRRCYAGLEPRAYSRYGSGQWRAPWPWTCTVVKDPFAVLAVPAVVACTGAVPVITYRHPGAVLASYRRMGWTADGAEMRRLQGRLDPPPNDDAELMLEFWLLVHTEVLGWLDDVPSAVLVSHAELSLGGDRAVATVMARCGLRPGAPRAGSGPGSSRTPDDGRLHAFDRAPEEVADGWRSRLTADEADRMDDGASEVWASLQAHRAVVS